MNFSIPDDANLSSPIAILEAPTCEGTRIGGESPAGVLPLYDLTHQKYFATIEPSANWAVSNFYSFDVLGRDEGRDIIDLNNQPLLPSRLIHAVMHEPRQSSSKSHVPSEVTCHRLLVGAERSDKVKDEDNVYAGSKLWGTPYIDNFARVGEAFAELEADGYRQLVQFDTPSPIGQPYVRGFPWDPGWLHVLIRKEDSGKPSFAFIIQQ